VDAIGIHIDPNGKRADIDIVDGDSQEEVCADGIMKDRFGHCNICENENVYLSYMDDPCGTATEVTGCVSNADCEANEYCALSNGSHECAKPDVGNCLPLTDGINYLYHGTEFLGNSAHLEWWAADNWCKAHGKQLVTFNDLEIDKTQLGDYFNEHNYCLMSDYSPEAACQNIDTASASLKETFSSLESYWVRDNLDVCKSFRMVINNTFAIYTGRREGSHGDFWPVLCK